MRDKITAFFKTTAFITGIAAAAALALTLGSCSDKTVQAASGTEVFLRLPAAGVANSMFHRVDVMPVAGVTASEWDSSKYMAGHTAGISYNATPMVASPAPQPMQETTISLAVPENTKQQEKNTELADKDLAPEITVSMDALEVENELWIFFESQGFTDAGCAGAIGNFYAECSLNPASKSQNFSVERKKGGAGLAGWLTRGRFMDLLALANARDAQWWDLSVQMEFIMQELDGEYTHVKNVLLSTKDPEYAADYFCVYYEGCIGETGTSKDGVSSIKGKTYQALSYRKQMAAQVYERHKGK